MTPYAVTADGMKLAVRLTPRSSRDGIDGVVGIGEGRADRRHFQKDHRQHERERESDSSAPPGHRVAVFADRPGEGGEHEYAHDRLQRLHAPSRILRTGAMIR